MTTHAEAESLFAAKKWILGQAIERRPSITGFERFCDGNVSSPGCSPVRRWDFLSNLLVSKSERAQADFSAVGLEAAIGWMHPKNLLSHLSLPRRPQVTCHRHADARPSEAGIEPSVGSVGDSYDNALAETIIGLYKAEVIHRRGPWRNFEAVEFATVEWVDWFNHR